MRERPNNSFIMPNNGKSLLISHHHHHHLFCIGQFYNLTMKVSTYLIVLSSLFPAVSLASCPGFSLGSTKCTSSSILSSSTFSASCSDDNSISVSGTADIGSDFDADAKVTLVPCVRGTGGLACFDKYKQEVGTICDMISSETVACGVAADDYTLSKSFDIPEEANKVSYLWSMITIKVFIGDEESCEQETGSSSSGYLMVGVAGMFAVGGVSLYFMRRRRRPLIVLDEDGEGTSQHRFIEMEMNSASAMA
jgi:LPXTG-motif cell wall-anchored protein